MRSFVRKAKSITRFAVIHTDVVILDPAPTLWAGTIRDLSTGGQRATANRNRVTHLQITLVNLRAWRGRTTSPRLAIFGVGNAVAWPFPVARVSADAGGKGRVLPLVLNIHSKYGMVRQECLVRTKRDVILSPPPAV